MIHKIYWFLSDQCGIDPRKMLRFILGLPKYTRDLFRFRSQYTGRLQLLPCLHDWYEEGGATRNEYFLQDLLVARMIHEANPSKHVDIGSRVDGFVAHVASFREIEVYDVRPMSTPIPGIIFKQADFTKPIEEQKNYCDSLSCLHALEHFGLGRYGDTIDSKGFEKGFTNMSALLRRGGVFYLSVPIGIDRVEFNGLRVSDPRVILDLAAKNYLRLSSLTLINPDGTVLQCITLEDSQLLDLSNMVYTLGIFQFIKDE